MLIPVMKSIQTTAQLIFMNDDGGYRGSETEDDNDINPMPDFNSLNNFALAWRRLHSFSSFNMLYNDIA